MDAALANVWQRGRYRSDASAGGSRCPKSIAAANEKIAEAKRRRKKFENEAEFYKKKQVPPEVEKGSGGGLSRDPGTGELIEPRSGSST